VVRAVHRRVSYVLSDHINHVVAEPFQFLQHLFDSTGDFGTVVAVPCCGMPECRAYVTDESSFINPITVATINATTIATMIMNGMLASNQRNINASRFAIVIFIETICPSVAACIFASP